MGKLAFQTVEELINDTPNRFKNRKANQQDIEKMSEWMHLFSKFLPTVDIAQADLELLEQKLGSKIPAEIKTLYAFIGNSTEALKEESLKLHDFQLLHTNDFWIEKDVIIKDFYTEEDWFKTDVLVYASLKNQKKALYGVDLINGWGLYHQKDWFWQKDDMPLFQKLTSLYVNVIIANKANVIKTKVKGITGIKRDSKAEELFKGTMLRLPDFEHYEHTIFISEELDLVGWFRAGMGIDFLVGSDKKDSLTNVIEKFAFTSAKFLKEESK